MAYRNTPHSTTNETPAKLLFGRNLKDKLPEITKPECNEGSNPVRELDFSRKKKGKMYVDQKRRARYSDIDVGDHVVVKNFIKRNKLTTTFNPQPHVVLKREGTRLTLENLSTGVKSDRHVNHTKQIICSSPFNQPSNFTAPIDDILPPEKDTSGDSNQIEEHHDESNCSTESRRNRKSRRPDFLKDYVLYNFKRCNN